MKIKKTLSVALCVAAVATFSSQAMASPVATPTSSTVAASTNQVGQKFTLAGVQTNANTVLMATRTVDLDLDGVKDTLYLIGDKNESPDFSNINIIVVNGKTNKVLNAAIKDFGGFNAKISYVSDFNNDHALDVMITAYSGGNNGSTNARIVTFKNAAPSIILGGDLKVKGERALFQTLEAVDVDNDGVNELLGIRTIHGEATSVVKGYEKVWFAFKDGEFKSIKTETTKEDPYKQPALGELTVGQPFALQGVKTTDKTVLIRKQVNDVNKDGAQDKIYLIGDKADELGYVSNINLVVVDGKTNTVKNANISGFDGYKPEIQWIGDFNGDKANDVMFTAYSGGNNGTTDAYIVSFAGDKAQSLLSVKPVVGGKPAFFNTLEQVDLNKDGVYDLVGTKRLHGDATATILGEEKTTFTFKDGAFKVVNTITTKTDGKTPTAATTGAFTVGKRFELKQIPTTAKTILLAKQQMDVSGNGVADDVFLIGNKDAANGGLVTDINIVVVEGKTKKVINGNIKGFMGYQPKISFIGDFNGDKSKDVMISVYSGGNSGSTNAYVVSFKDSGVKILLNEYVKVNGKRSLYNTMLASDVDKNGVYEIVAKKTIHGEATSVVKGEETAVLAYKNGAFQVRSTTVKKSK
ncbi:hypothetical protein [Paenibacillus macquariensis]|uniref:Repeat domain-containing protein n=1 Tax=Paenibacillus macquariensis TaxID=948756 RepID=A0ABY1KE00_9BACL|nr:hypothetical protein [Paenibacillus macquariensis]MEC0093137.1 hypothetical protein [Paenibacillus macquariensis]OAB29905.1 hypothetical protein PMSM_23500 [Paenibacillus macquariensis subsp. macquariensis]SIR68686.1 hypothetical protein SAMN05421578_13323 [Paenibacillus macquariensis]